ncbi:phage holin family protein [Enterobacter cancerogenus]
MTKSISIAIGGEIGFIGVEPFRNLVLNMINIRLGGGNAGK